MAVHAGATAAPARMELIAVLYILLSSLLFKLSVRDEELEFQLVRAVMFFDFQLSAVIRISTAVKCFPISSLSAVIRFSIVRCSDYPSIGLQP